MRRYRGKLLWLVGVLLLGVGILSVLQMSSKVQADAPLCPGDANFYQADAVRPGNSSVDGIQKILEQNTNADCANQLATAFTDQYQSSGRTMSTHDMAQGISTCINGESAGWQPTHQAFNSCANAYYYCMSHAVNVAECNYGPTLATMADDCGHGTIDAECITRMNQDNAARFQDTLTNATNTATTGCTGVGDRARNTYTQAGATDATSQGSKALNACNDQMKAAIQKCAPTYTDAYGFKRNQPPYTPGSDFVQNNKELSDFNSCLQQQMNDVAKNDPGLCSSVNGGNGFYMNQDYTDPAATSKGTSSNVSQGCYSQYSDLVNANACAAAKPPGTWTHIDDPSNPDHWECKPPAGLDENGKPVQTTPDATKAGQGGTLAKTTTCDGVRVNILGCPDKGGIAAIGDILKFAIGILTAIIGIASVGGLTWAAITYAKAGDNESDVSKAKEYIRNIIIGLLLYGFMVAIINFLVPGGVITG